MITIQHRLDHTIRPAQRPALLFHNINLRLLVFVGPGSAPAATKLRCPVTLKNAGEPQSQGAEGAAVHYCKPPATPDMGSSRVLRTIICFCRRHIAGFVKPDNVGRPQLPCPLPNLEKHRLFSGNGYRISCIVYNFLLSRDGIDRIRRRIL